jgi:hypothetical protein
VPSSHPDDTTILARWEQVGRPPIPIAFNDWEVVWKPIADMAIDLAIPQDPAERPRPVGVALHPPRHLGPRKNEPLARSLAVLTRDEVRPWVWAGWRMARPHLRVVPPMVTFVRARLDTTV